MKNFILAALLALPLSILAPQRASADGGCGACCFSTPPVGLTFGFRFQLKGGLMLKGPPPCGSCCGGCCSPCGGCGCGGGCAGPWYTYWPTDSHFQTPAPTGYPYWPSGQSAMMQHCNAGYGAPAMAYGYNYGAPPMAYGYNPAAMMAAGPSYGPPAPAMALPMAPAMNYSSQPTVQPCGYTPSQAPSYWYGR